MLKYFINRVFFFFIKTIFISLILVVLFLINWGNSYDYHLLKISKFHTQGVIVGNSRASQCLDPKFISGVEYNFSFSLNISPYDSIYCERIKQYLDFKNIKFEPNRKYIITIDPWCISSYKNDSFELINNSFLSGMKYNPSINTLLYCIKYLNLKPSSILNYLSSPIEKRRFFRLNKFGRVCIPQNRSIALNLEKSETPKKIQMYRRKEIFKYGSISVKRLETLKNLILDLKKKGNVYLVRLPTSMSMFSLEQEFIPNFSSRIQQFTSNLNIAYIDLSYLNDSVITVDGNHIWDGQSEWISRSLNDSLNAL
jgi:hypothetical protein